MALDRTGGIGDGHLYTSWSFDWSCCGEKDCTRSTDHGQTFSAGLPVTPVFDSTVGHPMQNKIGDYFDMESEEETAIVAYAATFNGEQDVWVVRVGDCNGNSQHDARDLSDGTSGDCDGNLVPDECQPDCNGNGVADSCDIAGGSSADCNDNGIPDECDLDSGGSEDCDTDGVPDECHLTDDVELGLGWTAGASGESATAGQWVHVDPNGTFAQPEDDHTPGSGHICWVTGQGTPWCSADGDDVDGGKTTLFSPLLTVEGLEDPHVGYWRWFYDRLGNSPDVDTFVVDVSGDDGVTWVSIETVGPGGEGTSGGWYWHSFRVNDFVPGVRSIRLRFIAEDSGVNSTVEAAIDDLALYECTGCTADIPGEVTGLMVSREDESTARFDWNAEPVADAYDLYRGSSPGVDDLACFQQAPGRALG